MRQECSERTSPGSAIGTAQDRSRRLWASESGLARIVPGKGPDFGSIAFHTDGSGTWYPLFTVWQPSRIELQFGIWKNRREVADEDRRRAFLDRLNQIPGIAIPPDKVDARPSIPLAALADPAARKGFTAARFRCAGEPA